MIVYERRACPSCGGEHHAPEATVQSERERDGRFRKIHRPQKTYVCPKTGVQLFYRGRGQAWAWRLK